MRKIVLVTFMRALGLRYLLHAHDYDYAKKYNKRRRLMRSLIRSIFRSAERVLVLGTRERQALSHHCDKNRIVVLLRRQHQSVGIAAQRPNPDLIEPAREFEPACNDNAVPDRQPDLARVPDPETPPHLCRRADDLGTAHVGKLISVSAAFDFHAGTKPRALRWMRHSGFEWPFRLMNFIARGPASGRREILRARLVELRGKAGRRK